MHVWFEVWHDSSGNFQLNVSYLVQSFTFQSGVSALSSRNLVAKSTSRDISKITVTKHSFANFHNWRHTCRSSGEHDRPLPLQYGRKNFLRSGRSVSPAGSGITDRLDQTDKSHSISGTVCSIHDIGSSNLTVSNVALISMTAAPATGQDLTLQPSSRNRRRRSRPHRIHFHRDKVHRCGSLPESGPPRRVWPPRAGRSLQRGPAWREKLHR